MKQIFYFVIAFALFFLVEFGSMILYSTFIDPAVDSGSLIGQVITYTIVIVTCGLLIYMIVKYYVVKRQVDMKD